MGLACHNGMLLGADRCDLFAQTAGNLRRDLHDERLGYPADVQREIVPDHRLRSREPANLGDPDSGPCAVGDVQLPPAGPTDRSHPIGPPPDRSWVHCSHPFGRHSIRRIVSATTPGETTAYRGTIATVIGLLFYAMA
jgi:hypothetical protein